MLHRLGRKAFSINIWGRLSCCAIGYYKFRFSRRLRYQSSSTVWQGHDLCFDVFCCRFQWYSTQSVHVLCFLNCGLIFFWKFIHIFPYVPRSSTRVLTLQLPDQICNSSYCQPYDSYNVSSENLVLDQLIIPKLIFFSFLITYLVDIVLIL